MALLFHNRFLSALCLSLVCFFLYPSSAFSIELYKRDQTSFTLSGSYKTILINGKTLAENDFWSDLNRLRLKFNIEPADSFLIKIIYDNEVTVGSILKKDEFIIAKDKKDKTLFDLNAQPIDTSEILWRHLLYRIYFRYFREPFNLTVGRQRISWGQARIWNPTDLFNPVSPLQIEGDQRLGVDAVSFEYSFGALSSLNLVYAPGDDQLKSSKGLRLRSNLKGYDMSVIFGEFREDTVLGFDFAGNIGDSGFRGEGVFTDKRQDSDFIRFVLSWDYSFPNTLYILFEYLYNGGNSGADATASVADRFSGEIVTKNRNFTAVGVGYDITPLLRLDSYVIYDMDGEGIFFNPFLTYNILNNVDWTAGLQIFSGDDNSEYGALSNAYYTYVEWFF